MEQLKKKQRENNLIKTTEIIKMQIINEIPNFYDKYYFVNAHEIEIVNLALSFIPPMLGTFPNFEIFDNVNYFKSIGKVLALDVNVWCKFATGGSNHNEIMPFGSVHNFAKDINNWLSYGSPLYLLLENKQDIIFIDSRYYVVEATIPRL